jgi:Na+/melibiose symporter-like transporter
LFLIGFQFGANNLLPSIFSSELVDEIEFKTGERLDNSIGFFNTWINYPFKLAIAAITPYVLYYYIGYESGLRDSLEFALDTKVKLLAIYTILQGVSMFLGTLPYLFWDNCGARRDEIVKGLEKQRRELAQKNKLAEEAAANAEGGNK